MSCCGTISNIIEGYVVYGLDKIFSMPAEKYEFAHGRIRICHGCEKQTWLTGMEYLKWLKDNGVEFIKNLDQLEKLPELPGGERGPGKKLFCKVCKCFVPAAAYVPDKKCPLNKWDVAAPS